MTREQYFASLRSIFDDGIALMEKKSTDYSGVSDTFANFRLSELCNVPVEKGIMVRITDKVARICRLLDSSAKVEDEKIDDTLIDLINYSAILLTYLRNERK